MSYFGHTCKLPVMERPMGPCPACKYDREMEEASRPFPDSGHQSAVEEVLGGGRGFVPAAVPVAAVEPNRIVIGERTYYRAITTSGPRWRQIGAVGLVAIGDDLERILDEHASLASRLRAVEAEREALRVALQDVIDSYDRWMVDPVDREGIADEIHAARIELAANPHATHGLGTADGPDEPDCPCRGTTEQDQCAIAGCGFCRAAASPATE